MLASRPLVALLCAVAALAPLEPAHAFVYAGNPELELGGEEAPTATDRLSARGEGDVPSPAVTVE